MNHFLIWTFGLITILFAVLTVIFSNKEKETPELICMVTMVLSGMVAMFFCTPGVN